MRLIYGDIGKQANSECRVNTSRLTSVGGGTWRSGGGRFTVGYLIRMLGVGIGYLRFTFLSSVHQICKSSPSPDIGNGYRFG